MKLSVWKEPEFDGQGGENTEVEIEGDYDLDSISELKVALKSALAKLWECQPKQVIVMTEQEIDDGVEQEERKQECVK